jgi:hypothetical protein
MFHYLYGFKACDLPQELIDKICSKPLSLDAKVKIIHTDFDITRHPVSRTLMVYCADQVWGRPDRKDNLLTLAGLTKRLANATPEIKPQRLRKIRRFARRHIFPKFSRLLPSEVMTFEEWLGTTIYTETRKRELRDVYKNISEEWEHEKRVGSFIKDEGYPEKKVSRWINASPDEFKVLYGPIVHSIEKKLFAHKSFIKTVPVEDRAKVIFDEIYREGAEYIETDYTSFEAHFTRDKMKIFHDFVMYMLGIPFSYTSDIIKMKHEVYDKIKEMSITTGTLTLLQYIAGVRELRMKGFGTFQMIARRCSGEMDTSSANGYSNFTMTEFAAFKMQTTVEQVVEGDDGLARYGQGKSPDDQFFLKYGWDIKLLRVRRIEDASFCGLRFDPEDKIVVCNIREAIAKFGLSNGRYVNCNDRTMKSLSRAKALSLCCQYSQVPMLGALARRVLELTSGVTIKSSIIDSYDLYERVNMLRYMKMKPWEVEYSPPVRTRELVHRLYNISIDEQISFEKSIEVASPYQGFRLGQFCQLDRNLEEYCNLHDQNSFGNVTNISKHKKYEQQLKLHWGKQLIVRRKQKH